MKNRAFTLMELLLATVIFTVTAMAVYTCFNTGLLAFRRTKASSEEFCDTRKALEAVASDLRNNITSEKWNFKGASESVKFVIPGLQQVNYYLKGEELMKASKSIASLLSEDEEGEEEAEDILLDSVRSLNFQYYYSLPESEDEFVWCAAWLEKETAPKGVRIELVSSAGNKFNKHVFIPTGIIGSEEEEAQ